MASVRPSFPGEICSRISAHTQTQTHTYPQIQTRIHTHIHRYRHAYTHANTDTHTHPQIQTRIHTHTHTLSLSLTHTHPWPTKSECVRLPYWFKSEMQWSSLNSNLFYQQKSCSVLFMEMIKKIWHLVNDQAKNYLQEC